MAPGKMPNTHIKNVERKINTFCKKKGVITYIAVNVDFSHRHAHKRMYAHTQMLKMMAKFYIDFENIDYNTH